jgi:beta-glucosidase
MCAYNAVDGQPACANDELLKDRLRATWKFDGHVVSDCAAIADVYLPTSHGYVKTPRRRRRQPQGRHRPVLRRLRRNQGVEIPAIVEAVRRAWSPRRTRRQAAAGCSSARMRLGLFDPPGQGPYGKITAADNDTPAHRALSLKAAKKPRWCC